MSGEATRTFWDEQAATFDDAPDHGLRDPETLHAWAALLETFLRDLQGAVVDLGCGTGSLSTLLADRGHQVLGVDLSPKMIDLAQQKARLAGLDIEFLVGDVQTASVPTTPCDAIVSRHILWAVSDPEALVARWSAPLTADGVFVAIEGLWDRAGLAPQAVFTALEAHFQQVQYIDLSHETVLWGKSVADHRYAVVGSRPRGGQK